MTSLIEDEERIAASKKNSNGVLGSVNNKNPKQHEHICVSNPTTVHFKIDQKSVTITDMSRKLVLF